MSVAMLAVTRWFDDAMQMLPLDLLTQASVQAARAKLLKHDWHFGSYMAWVSFHEMKHTLSIGLRYEFLTLQGLIAKRIGLVMRH